MLEVRLYTGDAMDCTTWLLFFLGFLLAGPLVCAAAAQERRTRLPLPSAAEKDGIHAHTRAYRPLRACARSGAGGASGAIPPFPPVARLSG